MNTIGNKFKVIVFGSSHGKSVGVIIEGVPKGLEFDLSEFQKDIDRRKPGKMGTTDRAESDELIIKSGILDWSTTGVAIEIEFLNSNVKSKDYDKFRRTPRPGHVDFVALKKYGESAEIEGSGQFSGRMTLPIVTAGFFAKKLLADVSITAKIIEIGGKTDWNEVLSKAVETQDSLGGVIECRVSGLPVGIGEPFFDSVESAISKLAFSIPSVKALEFGKGFESSRMKGSEYNDRLIDTSGRTESNNCGGITGGLSNGNDIVFRVAFRPPSSIGKPQKTIDLETGEQVDLTIEGRHDVCPVLRSEVIVEAVAAIALADICLELIK